MTRESMKEPQRKESRGESKMEVDKVGERQHLI